MKELLSPAAQRAFQQAELWAHHLSASAVEPLHLFLAILGQEETRGAGFLAEHRIDLKRVLGALNLADLTVSPDNSRELALAAPTRTILNSANAQLQPPEMVECDDLLRFLLAREPVDRLLSELDVAPDSLLQQLGGAESGPPLPLPTDIGPLTIAPSHEHADRARVLDAAANRAREGLRVVEDYARFARDDRRTAETLKQIRHSLAHAASCLGMTSWLSSRDTLGDVGTTIKTDAELVRADSHSVLIANFKRAEESLRTLEEFAKTQDPFQAQAFGRIRYQLYTVEKTLLLADFSKSALAGAKLYLLISASDHANPEQLVLEAINGGVGVVQLREKMLDDRGHLDLAKRMCGVVRSAGAIFILNDRPDLAVLCDADGVHLGQEDLPVRCARRIVGPKLLIGVSTHHMEQARAAVDEGANYLGAGPVFPSPTKSFDSFVGLDYVAEVSAEIAIPTYAIGGITEQNVHEVRAAGACRIAVSGAICQANAAGSAARRLRQEIGDGD